MSFEILTDFRDLGGVGYWYLASPYTKYHHGIDEAHRLVTEVAGTLIEAGVSIFSPVTHAHTVAAFAGLDPLDHDLWMGVDYPLMEAAEGLIIYGIHGWDESVGVEMEIEFFRDAGRPIYLLPKEE